MFAAANGVFASDCWSLGGLERPARLYWVALRKGEDIMSEMADFQEMSEVSSKPEKM